VLFRALKVDARNELMAAQSYAQLAIISKLQAKVSSLQTSLAKQAAKTQAAEASICKLEEAKTAMEGLLALAEARGKASVMRADSHLVILGLKKEAVATLVSPIILQDSAIDQAEPRSVPARSPGFDLRRQFCWCDEGWHCMCGLPDAN
jgi:hypothetical protein